MAGLFGAKEEIEPDRSNNSIFHKINFYIIKLSLNYDIATSLIISVAKQYLSCKLPLLIFLLV